MSTHPLYTRHPRLFQGNRFVYPVLSRRAGGISIGINLNPDKTCNFHCVYCQVDRRRPGETRFVETDALLSELDRTLTLVASGEIYEHQQFSDVPGPLRRPADIAFSGDGEPTSFVNFDHIVAACAEVKRRHGLEQVKMVLITNAGLLHREPVRRALEILRAAGGEIWAKLDAGTEAYYRRVARTTVPFRRILENITAAATARPLVIQSLFMQIDGEGPPEAEQAAYCRRLQEIAAGGGRIRLVQVYTVARPPAESFVAPLPDAEVDALADLVRRTTGLCVSAFYGMGD